MGPMHAGPVSKIQGIRNLTRLGNGDGYDMDGMPLPCTMGHAHNGACPSMVADSNSTVIRGRVGAFAIASDIEITVFGPLVLVCQ